MTKLYIYIYVHIFNGFNVGIYKISEDRYNVVKLSPHMFTVECTYLED